LHPRSGGAERSGGGSGSEDSLDRLAGEWDLIVDPRGWLSIIRGNPGNAADGLGVASGDVVWLAEPRD
jgi:hypothetical protein